MLKLKPFHKWEGEVFGYVCVCVCTRVNVWMYACFEPVKEVGEGKRMWKWEGDNFYIIISFKYSFSSCVNFFFFLNNALYNYEQRRFIWLILSTVRNPKATKRSVDSHYMGLPTTTTQGLIEGTPHGQSCWRISGFTDYPWSHSLKGHLMAKTAEGSVDSQTIHGVTA